MRLPLIRERDGVVTRIPEGLKERIEFNEGYQLSERDPEEFKDGYQLKWIGKDYARLQSGTAPETMLAPDTRHNFVVGNENSKNVFLTGDNLEVLKHLQNAYRGKVDMIYIDPPYNTGSDGFAYNDSFSFTDEELINQLGMTDGELKRLKSIQGKSSHSAWLTFMYPRLKVAQRLLVETGVIFISIDDNEQANLKLLCDEIFNENNFVAQLIWQNKKGGGNDSLHIATEHEYILVYARNKVELGRFYEAYSDSYIKRYKHEDEDGKFFWDTFKRKSGKQYYPIECPDGTILEFDSDGNPISWLRSKSRFERDLAVGEARIVEIDDRWSVQFKQRMPKGKKPRSIFTTENVLSEQGTTSDGSADVYTLFHKHVFPNPKPSALIEFLLGFGLNHDGVLLDFFAGAGTTAHAVMNANVSDGGDRRWILCNLNEPVQEGSEAKKQGFATVDEISRERIKRAAQKIREDAGEALPENFDGGFKHYKTINPSVATIDKIIAFDPQVESSFIAPDMITPFDVTETDTAGKDVILTTWMLADGYQLNTPIEAIDFEGYQASYVGGSVLYLIDSDWGAEQTKALLTMVGNNELNVNTIILYGYSFGFESLRELEINVKQVLGKSISIEKRY